MRLTPLVGLALALSAFAGPALGQTPPYTLDTLRVQVGSRASPALPLATRSVQVITSEEIARAPARTVAEVLASALGLDVLSRSPGQTDVAIRGGTFEQVLVLVDGLRMSDPQTGHFDLDLAVPLGEIERIEVLRGGASALYGSDALTGVVNVVTRRNGSGWEGSAGRGTFETWALLGSAAAALDPVNVRAAGDFQMSDGHRSGTDYETGQGRVRLEGALGGGTFGGEAAYAARDFGAANFYSAFPSYEETRTTTASLGWAPAPDARGAVEPRLHFRRHQDDFILRRENPGFYRNVHDSKQLGAELVARHELNALIQVVGGGEINRDRLESTNLGERSETRSALFAEMGAGSVGRAALTAGLRYDHHSAFGGFWAPSVAAAVWPRADLRFRLSAARGFRAPSWNERYYQDPANLGDPDLQPERSHEFEAGLDFAVGGAGRVSLSAFRRSARDLIDWAKPAGAPAGVRWETMNVERTVFRGLEAEAEWRDPRDGRWRVGTALLSFESTDTEGYVSKYALRPLSETLSLGVDQRLLDVVHLHAQATRASRRGEDPYFLLDARASFQFALGDAFVDGRNLTDASYRDVAAVPGAVPSNPGQLEFVAAPGRALHVGVSLRSR